MEDERMLQILNSRLEAWIELKRFIAELKKKYADIKQCPTCKHFVGCECFGGVCDQYEEKKE